ncbi:MAG: response regulator transcription factor [Elainellaceae cyanobacterium]
MSTKPPSQSASEQPIASHAPKLPLNVLLVEDDPVMQLGLSHLLSEQPDLNVVGQESDGYSGVQAALNLKPHLIVMDIGLPQLDGIAATQQIKAALPEVRIIMLTSHNTENETIAALSSGADAYCIKGIGIERLLTAIATVQEGAIYLDPQVARRVLDKLQPQACKPHYQTLSLTPRELEVLKLIVEGRSNPEIATTLYLSVSTVKTYVRSIMNKLAVDDRVQAAVVALRSGLV